MSPKIAAIRAYVATGVIYRVAAERFGVSAQYVAQVISPAAKRAESKRRARRYRTKRGVVRSLRCKSCSASGHNRATCPKAVQQ